MSNLREKELLSKLEYLESELDIVTKENNNLKNKLKDEKNRSRRLNLEAQRWFDNYMDLMNKGR